MKLSTSIISCITLIFIFAFYPSSFLKAQTVSDSSNEYSNQNKVYENHISYQKTVWRRSSLKEKQNLPFFVKGNEITKVIIDAVLLEKLKPYRNDSLKTEMSDEEFLANLTIPHENIDLNEEIIFPNQDNWNQQTISNDWNEEMVEEEDEPYLQFQLNQIYILRTKSDLFFDTRRNQMIHKITSIDLIIPAAINEATGLDKRLASFSYQEVMNYLFEENNFVWYNQRNNKSNLNPKEAFDLMLLSGILMQSCENNSYLFYGIDSKEELQKAHLYYNLLIEYESNFWEN
jgi:hypothetical protein